jgi:hypothetical protein
MVQRLEHFCEQLFVIHPSTSERDTCQMPISQLNLILPEEVKEVEEIVFRRQTNLVNEGKCHVHLSIDCFMCKFNLVESCKC